jgi:hypothetical protein
MPDRSSIEVVTEALGKSPERKFSETVEVAINVKDLDLTVPKNRLEDEIPLPNGRGKTVKVAVFGSPELCQKIRNVADVTITSAELDEFAKGAKKAVGSIDGLARLSSTIVWSSVMEGKRHPVPGSPVTVTGRVAAPVGRGAARHSSRPGPETRREW